MSTTQQIAPTTICNNYLIWNEHTQKNTNSRHVSLRSIFQPPILTWNTTKYPSKWEPRPRHNIIHKIKQKTRYHCIIETPPNPLSPMPLLNSESHVIKIHVYKNTNNMCINYKHKIQLPYTHTKTHNICCINMCRHVQQKQKTQHHVEQQSISQRKKNVKWCRNATGGSSQQLVFSKTREKRCFKNIRNTVNI